MSTIKRGILLLLSTICLVQVHSGETTYFLVGEPPGRALCRDSYVLPLSKQEDIDHARYLISLGASVFEGANAALVGARVGPGKDGINRNYVDPTFPEWSWHVIEFLRFADRSLIILDGCSIDVENDPVWYRGEDPRQGLIGFWNFTIVRELGPLPLYMSIIPEGRIFSSTGAVSAPTTFIRWKAKRLWQAQTGLQCQVFRGR